MPEPGSEAVGVAAAAGRIRAHLDALVRLQAELARHKARKTAISGFVVVVGAVLLGLSILVALAAIAAGLATVFDPWLAILILFAGLLILGLGFAAAGVVMFKRGDPSEPDQAQEPQTPPLGGEKGV